MTATFHMCLSVRGALNWPKSEMRRLAKCMTKTDGSPMTLAEAREALMDELAKGHEVIPIGKMCDNFDFKDGCQGHRDESNAPETIAQNRARRWCSAPCAKLISQSDDCNCESLAQMSGLSGK